MLVNNKYIIISIVSLASDYLLILTLASTIPALYAASIAHLLAAIINFHLLKNYVFSDTHHNLSKSFFKYILLLTISNIATIAIVHHSQPYLQNNLFLAKTLSVVVLFPIIFIINKKIIFRNSSF